jgi:predicted GNAT superfamily acetyltransferase
MSEIIIRNAEPADFATITALNEAAVQHTSAMDVQRLQNLYALSSYHKVVTVDGVVAGFLLAMREKAAYPNDNYGFFAARYETFVYIDRIVIAPDFTGLKLGSMLYRDLFNYARQNAVPAVTCEYNIEPPNEPSRRFHDKFGFKQVGSQWLDGGKKNVSLQMATP